MQEIKSDLKFPLHEWPSGFAKSAIDEFHACKHLLFFIAFADDLDSKRKPVHCRGIIEGPYCAFGVIKVVVGFRLLEVRRKCVLVCVNVGGRQDARGDVKLQQQSYLTNASQDECYTYDVIKETVVGGYECGCPCPISGHWRQCVL